MSKTGVFERQVSGFLKAADTVLRGSGRRSLERSLIQMSIRLSPALSGREEEKNAASIYRVEMTENDTRIHVDVYVRPHPTYCPTRTYGQLLNLRNFPDLFAPRFPILGT